MCEDLRERIESRASSTVRYSKHSKLRPSGPKWWANTYGSPISIPPPRQRQLLDRVSERAAGRRRARLDALDRQNAPADRRGCERAPRGAHRWQGAPAVDPGAVELGERILEQELRGRGLLA